MEAAALEGDGGLHVTALAAATAAAAAATTGGTAAGAADDPGGECRGDVAARPWRGTAPATWAGRAGGRGDASRGRFLVARRGGEADAPPAGAAAATAAPADGEHWPADGARRPVGRSAGRGPAGRGADRRGDDRCGDGRSVRAGVDARGRAAAVAAAAAAMSEPAAG